METVKTLARLHGCTGLPEPSLSTYVIIFPFLMCWLIYGPARERWSSISSLFQQVCSQKDFVVRYADCFYDLFDRVCLFSFHITWLVWVFAGSTGHFVGFVMSWLEWISRMSYMQIIGHYIFQLCHNNHVWIGTHWCHTPISRVGWFCFSWYTSVPLLCYSL